MYVCMQGPTNTLASVPLALSALAALAILASAVPSASQAGDLCQDQVGRTYPQSDPWKSSSCCGWLYLHPHYITNAHRKREGHKVRYDNSNFLSQLSSKSFSKDSVDAIFFLFFSRSSFFCCSCCCWSFSCASLSVRRL